MFLHVIFADVPTCQPKVPLLQRNDVIANTACNRDLPVQMFAVFAIVHLVFVCAVDRYCGHGTTGSGIMLVSMALYRIEQSNAMRVYTPIDESRGTDPVLVARTMINCLNWLS